MMEVVRKTQQLQIGNATCEVLSWDNEEINCITREHELGTYDVVADNGDETATWTAEQGGFTYIDLSLSLSVNNVKLSVSPTSDGVGYSKANVITNNPNGYILSAQAEGADLICETKPTDVIPSITSDGQLLNNQSSWGIGAGSFDSENNTWIPPDSWWAIPVEIPRQINNGPYEQTTETGDNYGLFAKVKVNFLTPVCVYNQKLIITATPEW